MCTQFNLTDRELNVNSISVDPHSTAKLGWVRGETYFDTYAPALPKTVSNGSIAYLLALGSITARLFLGHTDIRCTRHMILYGGMYMSQSNFLTWCVLWPRQYTVKLSDARISLAQQITGP